MGKINILSSDIFNLISAGEVVEKPLNIVKELVENSIDAGASHIKIAIYNGGKTEIRITDNGSGIEREDMEKVFFPHATSKISTKKDLERIGSLGFRGEAVSSIASVSRVKVISKTKNAKIGYSLENEFGKLGQVIDAAVNDGTTFIVSDLFERVPARKKFLRRDGLEERDITSMVEKLILANPSIIFEYSADDSLIYKSTGSNLLDAIYVVYGVNVSDNMIVVNSEYNGIKVSGYTSKPSLAKSNKTYQTLMVNGRTINNYMVSASVMSAYEGYLMKGKFPIFILDISLDLESVDVNIHPAKLEVKFENGSDVYKAVFSAINKAIMTESVFKEEEKLDFSSESKGLNLNGKAIGKSFSYEEMLSEKAGGAKPEAISLVGNYNESLNSEYIEKKENMSSLQSDYQAFMKKEVASNSMNKSLSMMDKILMNDYPLEQMKMEMPKAEIKVLANLFNTFILLEREGVYYLLDQHAGHERLLYDELTKRDMKNEPKQVLLFPSVIELNNAEMAVYEENEELIKGLGLEVSLFGKTSVKIDGVTVILAGINEKDLFGGVLEELISFKKVRKLESLDEKLKMMACKKAVKAHDKLSNTEIEILFNKFIENNSVLLCPHGRPSLVELTERELEKFFKRIV